MNTVTSIHSEKNTNSCHFVELFSLNFIKFNEYLIISELTVKLSALAR